MREIKFRFWSKGTSQNVNFKRKRYWTLPCYLLEKYYNCDDLLNSPDFIVEQFTGLKDKNSREIYEGDIVRDMWMNKSGDGTVDFIYSVVYIDNGFYTLKKGEIENGTYLIDKNDVQKYYVVIGNIHENPELLK